MKNYCTLLALLLAFTANAQIQIGSNEIATMNRPGKISSSDYAAFKKSTTIFTLQYKDYDQLRQYEEAIRSVWTVTPFKIVKPDEINDYLKKGNYSVFSFGGYTVQVQGSMTSSDHTHLTYDLWLPEIKKSGKIKTHFLARILIYPNNRTIFTAMKNANRRQSVFSSKMLSFIYNDAEIYSWGPGFLKGYLKTVNDHLSGKDERGPYSEETDKPGLAALKHDTLYVPDYVNIRFNMLTGAEKMEESKALSDFRDKYPYPLKIVTAEALNQLILDSGHPVKYLVYIKSSTDKYIDVFDSGSGKLLLARYVKVSYNFSGRDLKRVAKEVR